MQSVSSVVPPRFDIGYTEQSARWTANARRQARRVDTYRLSATYNALLVALVIEMYVPTPHKSTRRLTQCSIHTYRRRKICSPYRCRAS